MDRYWPKINCISAFVWIVSSPQSEVLVLVALTAREMAPSIPSPVIPLAMPWMPCMPSKRLAYQVSWRRKYLSKHQWRVTTYHGVLHEMLFPFLLTKLIKFWPINKRAIRLKNTPYFYNLLFRKATHNGTVENNRRNACGSFSATLLKTWYHWAVTIPFRRLSF